MRISEIIAALQKLDPDMDGLVVHDGSAYAIDAVKVDDGQKYGPLSGFLEEGKQPFGAIKTEW